MVAFGGVLRKARAAGGQVCAEAPVWCDGIACSEFDSVAAGRARGGSESCVARENLLAVEPQAP